MRGQTPPDTRLYAIGDIHGCRDTLRALLEQIESLDKTMQGVARRELIFLGDYIDRGPDSAAVVDILLHELPDGFAPVFLKGNHEAMMLDALSGNCEPELWLLNGGRETLASYRIDPPSRWRDDDDLIMQQLRETLAGPHMAFFKALKLSYRSGGYYFTHAGVNPARSLDDQQSRDLLWIREHFLRSRKRFEAVIVHGHTPVEVAELLDNRIGIDTGAVYDGKLTAVLLEGEERRIIAARAID